MNEYFRNIKEFGPESKDGPSLNSWKNSIRHNLSLHETFRRVPNEERGQSAYWVIDNEPKNQSPVFSDSTYKSYSVSDIDPGLLGEVLTFRS